MMTRFVITTIAIIIFIVVNIFVRNVAEEGCQSDGDKICLLCKCDKAKLRVECRNLTFGQIPENLPYQVKELSIKSDLPLKLSNKSLANCSQLERLDLSRTSLSELPVGIFGDTQKLSVLFLNNNQLGTNELNNDIFAPIGNVLRELYLSYNANFSNLILKDLHILEKLSIDACHLAIEFPFLKSLKYLRTTGPVNRLTNDMFQNLNGLTYLKLVNITTYSIDENVFKLMKNLKFLTIQDVRYLNLTQMTDALRSASRKIEVCKISHIVGYYNSSNQLTDTSNKNLKNMHRLQKLTLSRNHLFNLNENFAEAIPHVKELDLSCNRFSNVYEAMYSFHKLKNLTDLSMANQLKCYDNEEKEDNDENPNSEAGKTNPKQDAESPEKAKIKCVHPFTYAPSDQDSHPWCIISSPYLSNLQLAGAVNNKNLPPILILGKHNFNTINFNHNNLERLTGPIIIDYAKTDFPVIYFGFSYNQISYISPHLFTLSIRNGLRIGSLDFVSNNLRSQLERDENGSTFAPFKDLTSLSLSENKLIYLPPKIFQHLTLLESLSLGGNFLQVITFEIDHLKNLKELNIENNIVIYFDSNLKTFLDKRNSVLKVSLSQKVYHCKCASLPLLTLLFANVSSRKIQCVTSNGGYKVEDSLETIRALNYQCNLELPIMVSSILGVVIAVIVVITSK